MSNIDQTQYFYVIDEQHIHCDEVQFVYRCKKCGEKQVCYYCTFDYNEPCQECID